MVIFLMMALTLAMGVLSLSNITGIVQGAGEDASQPVITNVTMSLKNISGTIVFRFTADGTCSPGVDHVNMTFGIGNGTVPPDPPEEGWIGPIEMMYFGTGVSLRGTGPKSDPWSKWSFRMGLSVPEGTDPEDLLSMIGGIMGNETPDMEELNLSILDPDNIQRLGEIHLFLFARAYLTDVNYGQTSIEITDTVVPALLEFARSEGLTDDDDVPNDDEGKDDEGDGASLWPILIVAFIAAEVLFLVVVIYVLRKRRSRRTFRGRP
jgi:hypothetical protein